MARRLALALVLIAGVFWLGSTFAFDYPAKTQAVDNLTNSFRPVFTDKGIAQSQSDITTVNQFASQFQQQTVPALAKQLKTTPNQLVNTLSTQYPDVGAGLKQLPTSLPYFNHLVAGLSAQQQNFHRADAIPTASLPATTVHWLFVILGLLAVGIAVLGLVFARRLATAMSAAAVVVGVAVIAVSLILQVPTKAKAVDGMTNAFRPVFTTQAVAQTREYLTTVQAMDQQLTTQALPGLAAMLTVTPAALTASLGTNFPRVAKGLADLPQILRRFDGLTTLIEHNLTNFRRADSIPTTGTHTTLLEAQLAAPAGVLVLAGAGGLAAAYLRPRRQSRHPVAARTATAGVPG